MQRQTIIGLPLTLLALLHTGCGSSKVQTLNTKIEKLEKEVKKIKEEPSLKTKATPAFLNPTDTSYDWASDSNGMLYAISIINVEAIPGGVKYIIGITNIYSVGLNGVELDLQLGDQSKKIEVPEIINPGKRLAFPISFPVDNNNYPKYLLVNITSKGMQFGKQF